MPECSLNKGMLPGIARVRARDIHNCKSILLSRISPDRSIQTRSNGVRRADPPPSMLQRKPRPMGPRTGGGQRHAPDGDGDGDGHGAGPAVALRRRAEGREGPCDHVTGGCPATGAVRPPWRGGPLGRVPSPSPTTAPPVAHRHGSRSRVRRGRSTRSRPRNT
jgi:hypothetical protein